MNIHMKIQKLREDMNYLEAVKEALIVKSILTKEEIEALKIGK